MDNTEVKKDSFGDIDLYANQLKYNTYVEKKHSIYNVLFFISSIVSVLSIFVLPMYKYELLGKKRGQMKIIGEYTAEYIIEKYFNLTLGPHSLLNTCLVISIVAMIVLSVYILVGAVINLFAKKVLESNRIVSKLFNFDLLEVTSVVLFICLMLSMVFCKVDAFGNVKNVMRFWTMFISAIVMTCTSIALSKK